MSTSSPEDAPLQHPRRLRRLSAAVFGGYAVAVLVMAAAAFVALDVSSAARSYLRGESLWSKAQKDAVLALDQYADGGDDRAWDRYVSAREVPLGDRMARRELKSPDPDLERVRKGFVRGGLDRDETGGMIRLYRWLGWAGPVQRALEAWTRGDSLMAEVHERAAVVRREWSRPPPDTAVLRRAMEEVDRLAVRLDRTEREFADAIAEAAGAVERWTLWTVGGLAVLLLLGGGVVARRTYRVVRDREEALRRARERYRRIFRDSRDVVFVADREGAVQEVNPAGVELLGYEPSELQGRSVEELLRDPDDRRLYRRALEEAGEVEEIEAQVVTRDGNVLDCLITATARVEDGEVVGYQGLVRDVTEQKRFREELQHQALHDALTGLPNRALLWDRLEQAVARHARVGGALAVLFLDLDRFKVINDSLSHAAGDQVLVKVANRLLGCVRDPDTVARVGGDEFVVLVEDMDDAGEAERVAKRIAQALGPPFRVAGQDVHLDVSIGISGLEADPPPDRQPREVVDDLVRRADNAMYRAKDRRGTAVHRHESTGDREDSRIQRENELRRGLERQEFVIHYQPIVSLESGHVVGVEPLVRWRHPERGLLPPAEFLPLAEETGLVIGLGGWILEEACRRVAGWNRGVRVDDPLSVNANLSAVQFEDPDLGRRLEEILEATGLPTELLELEVTEHSVMQAPARTRALAERGVGVCIDDFGTGYSSLNYLKQLSADALKIDMSFVHGIGENRADEAIVRTILTLGRSLGLEVVAEGVETAEQLRWLREEGCRWAQGYLFGRPQPPEEIEALLEEGREVA